MHGHLHIRIARQSIRELTPAMQTFCLALALLQEIRSICRYNKSLVGSSVCLYIRKHNLCSIRLTRGVCYLLPIQGYAVTQSLGPSH